MADRIAAAADQKIFLTQRSTHRNGGTATAGSPAPATGTAIA